MNDNDLERQLRAQAGPREEGYTPTSLPATPDQRVRRSGMTIASRTALVGATVVAGAALALVLTRLPQAGPSEVGSGSSGATPTAHPTATQPMPITSCTADDFAWSTDPWNGAAGSRGTSVLLRGVASLTGCRIDGAVTVQIRDANGDILVSNSATSRQRAAAGDVFEVGIAWSNWCDADPAKPLSAVLHLPGDGTEIPLLAAGEGRQVGEIPVPPCNGETQPSNLSVTDIQPSTRKFPDG
jgi:hypothetical protein